MSGVRTLFSDGKKAIFLYIRYEKDNSKVGVSSDYGKQLIVGNDRFKSLKLMDLLPTLLNLLCLIMNST